MRILSSSLVLTVCLTFVTSGISQDELPDGERTQRPGPAAAPDGALYRQQVSYALGRNFAQNLREGQIECELESLLAGISDSLRDAQPKWTDEQLAPVMQRFAQEMEQKTVTRLNQQAAKNQQEAAAFLAKNGQREGVQTTTSGLQYRVIRQGDGPSPTLGDTVRCNYRGELMNGTEFDSSAQHGGPAEFPVRRVIPGWTEALQKMRVGDKWQLFVPPNLAYGADPPGPPIEANSLLVFEIELLGIVPGSE
jgi:FKBP-type peptidyl-prolyl cis-trans isomerase FklB